MESEMRSEKYEAIMKDRVLSLPVDQKLNHSHQTGKDAEDAQLVLHLGVREVLVELVVRARVVPPTRGGAASTRAPSRPTCGRARASGASA